jgi:hypothetical protein
MSTIFAIDPDSGRNQLAFRVVFKDWVILAVVLLSAVSDFAGTVDVSDRYQRMAALLGTPSGLAMDLVHEGIEVLFVTHVQEFIEVLKATPAARIPIDDKDLCEIPPREFFYQFGSLFVGQRLRGW